MYALMQFSVPRQKFSSRKEQGGQVGFEALIAERIPASELATDPDEAAGVAVLHNFIKTRKAARPNASPMSTKKTFLSF